MKPTDIDPLRVVPRDSSAVSFFANNFRNYILKQVEKYDFSSLRDYQPARLPDGTPFVRVQGSGKLPLKETSSANTVDHVVIAGVGSILPDDTTFLREVYGVASLMGGGNCVYRAILAEEELTLQPGSIVLRWGHSVGVFNVHENSILHGRASSDKELHLMPGVTFEWIAAPVISVESAEEHIGTAKEEVQRVPFELDDMIKMTDDTYRYNGDILLPDRSLVTGNLVVKGRLMIGPETCIRGNLKSHGAITLGNGCIVEGSIVTSSLLTIGKNCILWGPIISEKQITVGNGSAVGTQDKPATVSAPLVNLHSGVVVTGMVVAQSAGKTLS